MPLGMFIWTTPGELAFRRALAPDGASPHYRGSRIRDVDRILLALSRFRYLHAGSEAGGVLPSATSFFLPEWSLCKRNSIEGSSIGKLAMLRCKLPTPNAQLLRPGADGPQRMREHDASEIESSRRSWFESDPDET